MVFKDLPKDVQASILNCLSNDFVEAKRIYDSFNKETQVT